MRFRTAALVSTLVLLAACGKDSTTTAPLTGPSGSFRGTFVGSNSRGIIVIIFASPGATAITGSLALTGGATINLTGTYNPSSKGVSLAGTGYAVSGTYTSSSSHFSGDYTGRLPAPGDDTRLVFRHQRRFARVDHDGTAL